MCFKKLSKSFNPQLVLFKIKNTLLNRDAKVTQYDVNIQCCKVQKLSAKIYLSSKQTQFTKTTTKWLLYTLKFILF